MVRGQLGRKADWQSALQDYNRLCEEVKFRIRWGKDKPQKFDVPTLCGGYR